MKNPDWNKKNGGERPDGGILKPGERIDELQRTNYRIMRRGCITCRNQAP